MTGVETISTAERVLRYATITCDRCRVSTGKIEVDSLAELRVRTGFVERAEPLQANVHATPIHDLCSRCAEVRS